MDKELHDRLLAEGLALVEAQGVHGADVTPVLLEHFHTASGGVSIDANEALVLNNAKLATEVAVATRFDSSRAVAEIMFTPSVSD